MKNYRIICEAWDTGYGASDIIGNLANANGMRFSAPDVNVGTAIGAAGAVGMAAILTKYFREVKKEIIASETAEEAYRKFQDIVYNDRLIFTRRSLLKTPVIDRYFEKLVQRQDPNWKEKILKRLRWCQNMVYISCGIIGGVTANKTLNQIKYKNN